MEKNVIANKEHSGVFMKKKWKRTNLAVLGMCAMGFFAAHTLSAESVSRISEKHLAETQSYEKRAEELDLFIAEHEQMKKDYPKTWRIDPSLVPDELEVRWMNKHCDEIIRDAQKMKQNILEMGDWHRRKAAQPEEPVVPFSHVSEMRLSVSDHSGWMKEYEAKVAEQDVIIDEHEQAKQNYTDLSAQERCSAIIKNAKRQRDSFLEFAEWHRQQGGR